MVPERGAVISGVKFPEGTKVGINSWGASNDLAYKIDIDVNHGLLVLHRSKQVFGHDAGT